MDILRPVRQYMLNLPLKINEPCVIGIFFFFVSTCAIWSWYCHHHLVCSTVANLILLARSMELGFTVRMSVPAAGALSQTTSVSYSMKTHVTSSYVMLLNIYASYVAQYCDLFINFFPFLLHVPFCCVSCIDATDYGPVNNQYLTEYARSSGTWSEGSCARCDTRRLIVGTLLVATWCCVFSTFCTQNMATGLSR